MRGDNDYPADDSKKLDVTKLYPTAGHFADVTVGLWGKLHGVTLRSLRESVDYKPLSATGGSLSGNSANRKVAEIILGSNPSLVARYGSTELRALVRWTQREERTSLERAYALVSRFEYPVWLGLSYSRLQRNSGFFPITKDSVSRFVDIYREASEEIDFLASWVPGENKVRELAPGSISDLDGLSPFGKAEPWTRALEGLKVLVVHPFEESIKRQHANRKKIHPDGLIPDFELDTIRAVQSLGKAPEGFRTWFDALESMYLQTKSREFDIAILGCGAYGLPLGSRIKQDGKIAIVLGGITQLLFGIKGRRWDNSGLYNDYWVRPLDSEKPSTFYGVDKGAYW